MKEVVIVSAARTPIGSFGGGLKEVSAVDLGKIVTKEAIARAGIKPSDVDEVIFGNVLSAGLGQNIARQISVNSEIPVDTPAFTLNKVCGSGLKAVVLGAQAISCGDANVVIAGGTESMSNAMYALPNARWGARMGNTTLIDTMTNDGLTDAFSHLHMGITAENLAEKYHFSREELDLFSLESQRKAVAAQKAGKFKDEIVPVEVKTRKGTTIIEQDESPRENLTLDSLAKLSPAFKKDGVVTAGNSSSINDGAAAFVLMSKELAAKLNIKPLATLRSWASNGVSPDIMGYGPVPATQKAIEKANLSINELDVIEANEAFASQALSVIKGLNLDVRKVNVNGGAIALGHPIGASGARILVTLLYEMQRQKAKNGLATLCIGGGQGISIVVSRNE